MSAAVRIVILFCVVGLVGFVVAIGWAAGQESIRDGFRKMLDEPWGLVTLIDLYAGFFVIGAWIWVVEKRRVTAAVWLVLLFFLGNGATLLYLTIRARRARRFAELFFPCDPIETA
jgi:hypothetical protein